ncbi:MAG: cell division protein ZapB [Thermodesulfobacteriota bacterium]
MDLSTFKTLETKIEELLNRLKALKQENDEVRGRLEEKEREVAELTQLLSVQDAERDQVRERVEGLLAKLESL